MRNKWLSCWQLFDYNECWQLFCVNNTVLFDKKWEKKVTVLLTKVWHDYYNEHIWLNINIHIWVLMLSQHCWQLFCVMWYDMINFHVISLIMMNYNHAISPPKTLVNTNGDCDVDIDNNFWSIRLWFMHLPLTSIIIYCHILVLLWSMFQPFFLIFGFHWSYTEVSLTWH